MISQYVGPFVCMISQYVGLATTFMLLQSILSQLEIVRSLMLQDGHSSAVELWV